MENRNHRSINRFFLAMSFSLVVLSIKVVIKEFNKIETVETLFQTFGYLFIISLWVGLVGLFTQMIKDAYADKIKKNGNWIYITITND